MQEAQQALLALGLVLLATPLWGPVADLTGEDHVYRTANVTVVDDTIQFGPNDQFVGPVEGIDCTHRFADEADERGCYLESTLRHGNAAVDYPPVELVSGSPRVGFPEYVVFGTTGQPYRRTVGYNYTTDEFVLGLEPADPEAVLADVASDPDQAHPAVRKALRTGVARTNEPVGVETGRVYARGDGDGYAVVYRAATPASLTEKPLVERGFEALALALGALAIYRGGRRVGRGDENLR